jgi:hypothetical protein
MGSCVLRETIRKGRPRFAQRVSLSIYLGARCTSSRSLALGAHLLLCGTATMRRKSCTGARAEQLRRQRTNTVGSCANHLGSSTNLCGSSSGAVSAQPPSLTPQESRVLAPWTTSGPPLCLEGTIALPPHDTATERIEQYRRRCGVGMKGELHLTGLALNNLPPPLYGLRNLTNLKELYLAHNTLGAIPDELAQLASLEKLDLTSNLLVEFPPAASQVSHSAATVVAVGPAL